MAKKTTLKVGIIGTGGISGMHYKGYARNDAVDVYALCDVTPAVLAEKSEAYGVPKERCFTDYKDLLKLKELDAVSVCTSNKYHCRQTIDALRAGLDVLCEKPMAMTPAEAKRMVDTAAKTGRQLQIGLMQRFRPDAQYVKGLVDDGVLGEIYYARCQAVRRRGVPSWGVFGQLAQQGGGGLIDIGVHQIDLTWWLMGAPRPVAVSGQTYRTIGDTPGHFGMFGVWDHKTYTVEDFASALVRFDNGATMSIECSFVANLDKDREGCNLVGRKGGAGLSPMSVVLERNGHLMDCTPQHLIDVDPDSGMPIKIGNHEKEVLAFCDAVLSGKPVPVPGSEAIWTQKIIDGIYRSAKLGREVKIH